jgi:hypothetical protein
MVAHIRDLTAVRRRFVDEAAFQTGVHDRP